MDDTIKLILNIVIGVVIFAIIVFGLVLISGQSKEKLQEFFNSFKQRLIFKNHYFLVIKNFQRK
ncbi:MAG: hypothetical protein QXM68_03540 [Candidatus Aenigmatarchaeota archaeon]|nr:hypothetical protein [Candidatus Aenigmarchaeota archaeon]